MVTRHHRSRDHSIHHGLFPIGGPLEQRLPLYRFPRYSVANVTQRLTVSDMTLNDLYAKAEVIHFDSSYTTSYRLSIVTFALGHTILLQYIPYSGTDD